ncbi:hypothetical protein DL766_003869 [Monosporascus sp. MC13-8B]|uniref:Uncharacterized protein n=1 Tax=Monosporascus cannonballus TaxID=155416 RepID=A0ABY0HDW0_9PEZI|nr:hypothetical protein DL763_010723 [Monosporascus cannonballus]RYO90819.1 hypothetical protein DL762_002496 [Monosporascus cannonballus]RYP32649.1 hypothetical protein DL766_003869 [Monosporascus sp. MC13-8B]
MQPRSSPARFVDSPLSTLPTTALKTLQRLGRGLKSREGELRRLQEQQPRNGFPRASDRDRSQGDVRRLRDVVIPDLKRKIAEKRQYKREAEKNAKVKAFKGSLDATARRNPLLWSTCTKPPQADGIHDSEAYNTTTAQGHMATTPYDPAVLTSPWTLTSGMESSTLAGTARSPPQCAVHTPAWGWNLAERCANQSPISHMRTTRADPAFDIGGTPLAGCFPVDNPLMGPLFSIAMRTETPAHSRHHHQRTVRLPAFGWESCQQLFQAASRAAFEAPTARSARPLAPPWVAFEIPTSSSARLPTLFSWSLTPSYQVLVVEDATDDEDNASSLNLFKDMPNLDPSAAARSSHFSMYEPRGAASDSDQLTGGDLPTPLRPSKRLRILYASEVSSLPPSGNLGGRTHVSDSDLDEDEDDSQVVCQNYRNTPPSHQPEHTVPAAGRSIIIHAGESSPQLPCLKMSLCLLYSPLLPPLKLLAPFVA